MQKLIPLVVTSYKVTKNVDKPTGLIETVETSPMLGLPSACRSGALGNS